MIRLFRSEDLLYTCTPLHSCLCFAPLSWSATPTTIDTAVTWKCYCNREDLELVCPRPLSCDCFV